MADDYSDGDVALDLLFGASFRTLLPVGAWLPVMGARRILLGLVVADFGNGSE